MRFEPTSLDDAWVIELDRHADERGWFARSHCDEEFAEHGLPTHFPQSNLSSSRSARTLRGMHVNVAGAWESKVVRCVRGSVFDVIVDLRPGSTTRHRWFGTELSAENGRAVFVPEGFAHGFLTLVDDCDVHYQMGRPYVAEAARGFRWDDPTFSITWPAEPAVLSARDAAYPDYDPAAVGVEAG